MSFWAGFAEAWQQADDKAEREKIRKDEQSWRQKLHDYTAAQDKIANARMEREMEFRRLQAEKADKRYEDETEWNRGRELKGDERQVELDKLALEKWEYTKRTKDLELASELGLTGVGSSTGKGKKDTSSKDQKAALNKIIPILKTADDKDAAAATMVALQADPRNAIEIAKAIEFATGPKGDRSSGITGNDLVELVTLTKPENFSEEVQKWKGNVEAYLDLKENFNLSTATPDDIIQLKTLQELASASNRPQVALTISPTFYRPVEATDWEKQRDLVVGSMEGMLAQAMKDSKGTDAYNELNKIKDDMDNKNYATALMRFGPDVLDDFMTTNPDFATGIMENPTLKPAIDAWHSREAQRHSDMVVRMSEENYQTYLNESGYGNANWSVKRTVVKEEEPKAEATEVIDITGKTEEEVREVYSANPDAQFTWNGKTVDLVGSTKNVSDTSPKVEEKSDPVVSRGDRKKKRDGLMSPEADSVPEIIERAPDLQPSVVSSIMTAHNEGDDETLARLAEEYGEENIQRVIDLPVIRDEGLITGKTPGEKAEAGFMQTMKDVANDFVESSKVKGDKLADMSQDDFEDLTIDILNEAEKADLTTKTAVRNFVTKELRKRKLTGRATEREPIISAIENKLNL